MPLKEITDRKGRRFTWIEIGVHNWPLSGSNVYFPQDPEKQLKEVKSIEIRDNDVLICTFPKAGRCRHFQFHYENKDQLHKIRFSLFVLDCGTLVVVCLLFHI